MFAAGPAASPLDPPTRSRDWAPRLFACWPPGDAPPRVIVGRDTRESGQWIEAELARGASVHGAIVTSVGVVPTPAVAYLAGRRGYDLGVVISASHNPFADNGIKVFSGRGEKFGESLERGVEEIVADDRWAVSDGAAQLVSATDRPGSISIICAGLLTAWPSDG